MLLHTRKREADRAPLLGRWFAVLLSSVPAGLGARGFGAYGISTIGFFAVVALRAWVAWSVVIYRVGVRLLPAADTRTMCRAASNFLAISRPHALAAFDGLLKSDATRMVLNTVGPPHRRFQCRAVDPASEHIQ